MRRLSLLLAGLLATAGLVVPAGAHASAPTRPAAASPVVNHFRVRSDPRVLDARARVRPERFRAYRLDTAALGRDLQGTARRATSVRVVVPGPDGVQHTFALTEDSVLAPALQARHPHIRTYAGYDVDRPSVTGRFDLTPMGFHASVSGLRGRWYVDPAVNARGATTHLSYWRSAVPDPSGGLPAADVVDGEAPRARRAAQVAARTAAGETVVRRTYRLAFVTDPSYAAYFGSANVLAEKTTLINRVDQIYNDDLAIKLELVDGTDRLNLDTRAKAVGAIGPCGASACYDSGSFYATGSGDQPDGCTGDLLTRNDWALGQLIGADAYDVGHIGLGVDGGGLAGLGVVGTAEKAEGCTGITTPDGDVYAVDYVAHEIGHQFGADHTFNGTEQACAGGNRNASTSVEPGSGSSVMAYAGICGTDDLQAHTDPYFSQRSIDQITADVAAVPDTSSEQQTVALSGFDTAGETIELGYPGATAQTITFGTLTYTAARIARAVQTLTGQSATVSGYDGGLTPTSSGFSVQFASSGSLERLSVTSSSPGVSGFVGVQVDGGPQTNGGAPSSTTNHAPTVIAPPGRTIPIRTPFTLDGSGSDTDGDGLVYLWEQNDAGSTNGTSLVSNAKSRGPLFRVFGTASTVSEDDATTYRPAGENVATGSASRTFPDAAQIAAGATNAATGSCPAVVGTSVDPGARDCYSEFLPTSTRTLHFRLTARDRNPAGGGTQYADTTLSVGSAGPFLVTSPSSPARVEGGTTGTVTWAVNGTDAAAYAPSVRVLLSTDGGLSFPTTLVASTANDGSETVTWPSLSTAHARIKVEAIDNYFFAVSAADLTITSPVTVSPIADQSVQYGDPLTGSFTGRFGDGSAADLSATVSGLAGVTIAPGAVTGSSRAFTFAGAARVPPGRYPVTVTVGDGISSGSAGFTVVVTPEDAVVAYLGPLSVSGSPPVSVPLSAQVGEPDDGSPGDLSTATVTFSDRDSGATLCRSAASTSGIASCTARLAPREAAYRIAVVVGGNYLRDSIDDDVSVSVSSSDDGDQVPPATTRTAGPTDGSFVLSSTATFALTSSEDDSTFTCAVDGVARPCADGSLTLRGLGGGTHVLTAAATDAAGNTDATPILVRWTVPLAARSLRPAGGGWSLRAGTRFYGGRAWATNRPGRRLVIAAHDVVRTALVVTRAPRAGVVRVSLDGRRIATVRLRGSSTRHRALVVLPRFAVPRSGRLVLRTTSARPVRIEGVGLWSTE